MSVVTTDVAGCSVIYTIHEGSRRRLDTRTMVFLIHERIRGHNRVCRVLRLVPVRVRYNDPGDEADSNDSNERDAQRDVVPALVLFCAVLTTVLLIFMQCAEISATSIDTATLKGALPFAWCVASGGVALLRQVEAGAFRWSVLFIDIERR